MTTTDASRPSVAICIPTYNQEQYVETAVRTACTQTYDGPIEVWVSDDASTDGTAERMQRLSAELPQVHYHRQPQNGGIAVNNSWLMRRPSTRYLVRLDSDDFLHPEYIATLVAALEAAPQAGYAHTAIQEIDGAGRKTRERRLVRPTGYQDAEMALRASLHGYRTAANILMFRTEALRELSYYDGRPEFVEDYDLSVRMADAGYGNVYVDEVLASYRVWNDAANKRAKRKRVQLAGYIRIFDESLQPAFARRGWDMEAVRRQRQRLAAINVVSSSSSLYTPEERRDLQQLLLRLGDSPEVRLRLALCRYGMSGVVGCADEAKYRAKDFVKGMLSRARHLRGGAAVSPASAP